MLSYALIYGSTREDPTQYSGRADGLRLFCEILTIIFLMFYFFEEVNQAERWVLKIVSLPPFLIPNHESIKLYQCWRKKLKRKVIKLHSNFTDTSGGRVTGPWNRRHLIMFPTTYKHCGFFVSPKRTPVISAHMFMVPTTISTNF